MPCDVIAVGYVAAGKIKLVVPLPSKETPRAHAPIPTPPITADAEIPRQHRHRALVTPPSDSGLRFRLISPFHETPTLPLPRRRDSHPSVPSNSRQTTDSSIQLTSGRRATDDRRLPSSLGHRSLTKLAAKLTPADSNFRARAGQGKGARARCCSLRTWKKFFLRKKFFLC